jgi:hypothetical protein
LVILKTIWGLYFEGDLKNEVRMKIVNEAHRKTEEVIKKMERKFLNPALKIILSG